MAGTVTDSLRERLYNRNNTKLDTLPVTGFGSESVSPEPVESGAFGVASSDAEKAHVGRPTKTEIPIGDKLVKTGFKIPSTLYERIREIAWRDRLSMNTVVCVGMEQYISEREKFYGIEKGLHNTLN